MNNISTDSLPEENTTIAEDQTQENSLPPLLPRSAWDSQLAYLRVVFRAKKALDRIEFEANMLSK